MITASGREERTTKRVALYARVSTLNHGQDPEVQLRELREFCQRRGFRIIEEFADRGISGSRERRPALDQLMAICRKRLVDAVVVYRYDRPTGPSKTRFHTPSQSHCRRQSTRCCGYSKFGWLHNDALLDNRSLLFADLSTSGAA